MDQHQALSKGFLWAGTIITGLVTIFLLIDGFMKVINADAAIQSSVQLGWPAESVQGLGIVLLLCTIGHAVPRTSVLGAILLTGYLGGAVAIMFRASAEGHPYIFPIVFGMLIWAGLFLQDPNTFIDSI